MKLPSTFNINLLSNVVFCSCRSSARFLWKSNNLEFGPYTFGTVWYQDTSLGGLGYYYVLNMRHGVLLLNRKFWALLGNCIVMFFDNFWRNGDLFVDIGCFIHCNRWMA